MSHRIETSESFVFNQNPPANTNKPMTTSKQIPVKPEIISTVSELRKSTEIRESPCNLFFLT